MSQILRLPLNLLRTIQCAVLAPLLFIFLLVPYSSFATEGEATGDLTEQGEVLRNLVFLNSIDNAVILKAINLLRKYPYEEINEVLTHSIKQELYRVEPDVKLIRLMLLALKERATVRDRKAVDSIQLDIFNSELDQKLSRESTRSLDQLTEDIISDISNKASSRNTREVIRLNHPLKDLVLAVIHNEAEEFATLADDYIRADGKPQIVQKLFQVFTDPKFKRVLSRATLKIQKVQEMVSQLTGTKPILLTNDPIASKAPVVVPEPSAAPRSNEVETSPKVPTVPPGTASYSREFTMAKMWVRQVVDASQCEKLFR